MILTIQQLNLSYLHEHIKLQLGWSLLFLTLHAIGILFVFIKAIVEVDSAIELNHTMVILATLAHL
jgi:hypothetical protein